MKIIFLILLYFISVTKQTSDLKIKYKYLTNNDDIRIEDEYKSGKILFIKSIDKKGLNFQIHVKEELKYIEYRFIEVSTIMLYLQSDIHTMTDYNKEIKDNKNIYSFSIKSEEDTFIGFEVQTYPDYFTEGIFITFKKEKEKNMLNIIILLGIGVFLLLMGIIGICFCYIYKNKTNIQIRKNKEPSKIEKNSYKDLQIIHFDNNVNIISSKRGYNSSRIMINKS